MSRSRTVPMASVVGCVLLSLALAPAQAPKPEAAQQGRPYAGQKLLKGNATRIKYPLGRPAKEHEEGEDFLAMRRDYYIRPRAFPKQEIDPRGRLRAYEQLKAMRKAQEKHHIPAGWLDKPGRPGALGPGGCAWSSVGPTNINGRVTKIAIDPNSNQRIFVTTVGGIWRSRDGGRRWQRVSDDFLASVFASVAINPGNGNEVVAGGGDPNYASAGSASGLGIWRSTVGGDPGTWSKVSPPELDGHVIFRIRYDPASPNDIYAATSNGVYLGTHAGSAITWSRIGGFDASASDLVVDFSSTPRKIYAGVRDASASFARGIWKFDGTSWQKRDTGITTSGGRTIALALAASSPNTIYAKFENVTNGRLMGVFKTSTGGEAPGGGGNAWTALPGASVMDDSVFSGGVSGYSWYNSVLEVDPADANVVYGGGLNIFRTTDGGTTWANVSGGADPVFPVFVHADHHAVAFDPASSKVVFVGDDGGIYRSTNTSAVTWHWNDISHGMVVTEFYRIASQQATATILAGGSQDNGTEITFGNRTWYQFGGCDGADVAIDGQDSVTVYANCNGSLYETTNPVPGTPGGGSTATTTFPAGLSWTPPVISDPTLAGRALAAGNQAMAPQRLLKTVDGLSWTAASPALPAGDQISFIAIAPSSSFQGYYVGVGGPTPTVWRTTDGGATWATTASGLPSGLWPNAGTVDWTNPARAFVGFGGGAGGGVFVTSDGGANWTGLPGAGAGALPNTPVTGVVVDPNDANVLYVSTAIGAFQGQITPGSPPTAFWSPFDEGLPDGIDLNGIWVNRSTGVLSIGSVGHGTFQRNINPGATCPAALLVVRDTVFDHGLAPSASGLPDAEHPIPDPARPGFFKPNDTAGGRLYWWSSPDIRIDVPSLDPPANQIASADHVEFETCPIEIASCPPGVMKDSNPVKGRAARAYIQVTNRGLQPASNVRVIALWADATAGLPLLPSDFWSVTFPAGGGPCGPLDTSTGWNFVDPANPCRTIPVVNPALPEVVGFPWDVPSSAADHSCMLTIIESADDPIDPSVRATNERRPWVFIPNNRQIGLRNLHLVTASSPQGRPRGLEVINVPNPDRELGHVEVILSRGDLAKDARVALLFPPGLRFKAQGLEAVKEAGADRDLKKFAEYHKLDPDTLYVLSEPEARIESLAVPPGQTLKVGLQFDGGAQLKPGTASRFTIMTKQGRTVLGGSTYVLRIPDY